MNPLWTMLAAFALVAIPGVSSAAPTEGPWEQGTIEVGAELLLPTCHDFSVGDYDGRACSGDVRGKVRGLVRAPGGFLLQPQLSMGVAYDTDLVVAHYFDVDEPMKEEEFSFSFVMGLGGSKRLRHGEVRVTGGPRLQVLVATSQTRSRTAVAGFDLDPYGRISLSGVLDLEIDGEIGESVRLGPRLHFGVGNEVGLLYAADCTEESAWCDDARLIHRDVEIDWAVSFGMSFPAASHGAIALEIGPRFDLSAYENTTYEELGNRRYDRPRCTLDIAPQLFVGAQIRI